VRLTRKKVRVSFGQHLTSFSSCADDKNIGRVMKKFARQLEGSTNLGEMKTITIPKSLTTDLSCLSSGCKGYEEGLGGYNLYSVCKGFGRC